MNSCSFVIEQWKEDRPQFVYGFCDKNHVFGACELKKKTDFLIQFKRFRNSSNPIASVSFGSG